MDAADVLAKEIKRDGDRKRLRIHTWDAQVDTRAAKWLNDFEIKPDTWYRMKLSVADPLKRKWERGVYMGQDSTNPEAVKRHRPQG